MRAGSAKPRAGSVNATAVSGLALRKAVNHPYHYLGHLANKQLRADREGGSKLITRACKDAIRGRVGDRTKHHSQKCGIQQRGPDVDPSQRA